MRQSNSLRLKLVWLLTAFVIVSVSASGVGGEGSPAPAEAARGVGGSGVPSAAGGDEGVVVVEAVRGRVVEEGGVRLGVLALTDEPAAPGGGSGGRTGGVGERLVCVLVALKNVGEGGLTYTALDLELWDAAGGRYVSVDALGGPGPMLTYGSLAPAEGVAGWRAFRVPEEAGPFRLALELSPRY